MVTMNGECHNEWKSHMKKSIETGAIAFAIFNYYRFTGITLIFLKRTEVLVVLHVFGTKANFSKDKNQYVI
jgi:maltose phosphorylase